MSDVVIEDDTKASEKEIRALRAWVIPANALDGWYWKIDAISALWEGVIMPRRV